MQACSAATAATCGSFDGEEGSWFKEIILRDKSDVFVAAFVELRQWIHVPFLVTGTGCGIARAHL